MMQSKMSQMIPMAHTNYLPFNNNYKSEQSVESSTPDNFVLDLSKPKRALSPDYTYGYPSPKFSPNECQIKHSPPASPNLEDQSDAITRLRSPLSSTSPSSKNSDYISVTSPDMCSSNSHDANSVTSETSNNSLDIDSSPKRKIPRPFKTLAKDSVALTATVINQLDTAYSTSSFIIEDQEIGPEETKRLMEESAKKYAEFREKMLIKLRNSNNTTNQNMRRMQNNSMKAQDVEYLEKRRKNNEAAKRSRDARRIKQDEIAIRVTFLEQENLMLKFKVKSEIEDLERLRKMELQRINTTPASL